MIVRLTQIDGSIPNLALMRLAAWHRAQGDEVHWNHGRPVPPKRQRPSEATKRKPRPRDRWPFKSNATIDYSPSIDEPAYDVVYASAIFETSEDRVADFRRAWPDAIIGGSGGDQTLRVEDVVPTQFQSLDYSGYPDFEGSIGYAMRGCRYSCKFCLLPDTLIITSTGLRKICEIKEGDLVLTHEGRYRRVTETMTRHYEGPIHRLNGSSLASLMPVWATPEHPAFTMDFAYSGTRLTASEPQWRQIGDLTVQKNSNKRYKHAYPRTLQTVLPPTVPGLPRAAITSSLLKLIGWYLADGYVASAKGRDRFMLVVYPGNGDKGRSDAESIMALMEDCGLKAAIYNPPSGDQYRVQAYSVDFCRWLVDEFGSLAHAKRIPLWVRLLPKDLLGDLIDAYSQGDGCDDLHHGSPRTRIATVSQDLAISIREIALKCGWHASVNRSAPTTHIQGRAVNARPVHHVVITRSAPQGATRSDDLYLYTPIKQHETVQYNGPVCNFEVEEDHSYCTPAFALHNCVVPMLEGKARSNSTIARIWRGPGHPKRIHLLDNDFFGNPAWRDVVAELVAGGFQVCINQGLNVRALAGRPKVPGVLARLRAGTATESDLDAIAEAERAADEQCAALASLTYKNDAFSRPTIYAAWDNLGDEAVFFEGVDRLERHGIPPHHLTVYMLVGYDPKETWERIMYRYRKMVDRGVRPYPMVFGGQRKIDDPDRWAALKRFQSWVITGAHKTCRLEDFRADHRAPAADDGSQPLLL